MVRCIVGVWRAPISILTTRHARPSMKRFNLKTERDAVNFALRQLVVKPMSLEDASRWRAPDGKAISTRCVRAGWSICDRRLIRVDRVFAAGAQQRDSTTGRGGVVAPARWTSATPSEWRLSPGPATNCISSNLSALLAQRAVSGNHIRPLRHGGGALPNLSARRRDGPTDARLPNRSSSNRCRAPGASRRPRLRRVGAAHTSRCRLERGSYESGRLTRSVWWALSPQARASAQVRLRIQVQVVLDRVADGAVALQRLAADEFGGVGRHRLGHRHVAAARRSSWATDHAARHTAGGRTRARAARRRGGASPLGSCRSARRTACARSRRRRSCRASLGRGRRASPRCRARRGRAARSMTASLAVMITPLVAGVDAAAAAGAVDGVDRRDLDLGARRRGTSDAPRCNSNWSASAAHGTIGPPRSDATMPSPSPSSGAATIAVSTSGCGSATRPASSRMGTR